MKIIKILIVILVIYFMKNFIISRIPLRGIVEGFYGNPWTFEDRVDLLKFSREYKLNAYIYAPKDDPYHREKWREPYPDIKIQEFKKLIKIAKFNKVRFIFAVSPGLDLSYNGEKGNEDFNFLMAKLDSIYKVGCKDFAIFFDDIKEDLDSGKNQAYFLNKVQEALKIKYSNINPLITVPTEYYLKSMIDDEGNIKQYTKNFTSILNKDIIVLYTGDKVVPDGIPEESFKKALEIYKRDLGIWWNYPVNDFLRAKLALGPIEKLPTSNITSIFFNPMEQFQLSKIALATGAEYSYSPQKYDANISWDRVLKYQFKKIAPAMKVFASHSRHMENSWASIGPSDGPEFYEEAHQVVINANSSKKVDFSKLNKLINEMENSANILLKYLPPKILAECKLQIEQFKRIIKADRVAIKSLQDKKFVYELISMKHNISLYENEAIISEKSALKFIDEVIDLLNGQNNE